MGSSLEIKILDITRNSNYEKYLYSCITPFPFRRYRKRHEYLAAAIPRGLQKKLLIFNGDVVGQIEYVPAEASGYPIAGDDIIVMNCIWVLRRAKGHNFGKQLFNTMTKSMKNAAGFATIALENHWSGWLRKEHMEMLGFKSIDSINVTHKTKIQDNASKYTLCGCPQTKTRNRPHGTS